MCFILLLLVVVVVFNSGRVDVVLLYVCARADENTCQLDNGVQIKRKKVEFSSLSNGH